MSTSRRFFVAFRAQCLNLAVTGCALVLIAGMSANISRADIITSTTAGKSGRFVRVTNNGSVDRLLHISELEVYGFGVTPDGAGLSGLSTNDVAATYQGDGAASNYFYFHGANTNIVNSLQETGGDTYTIGGVGAFQTIDLGSTVNVGTARPWQRFDGCCQERLSNVTVSLLADNAGTPGAVVAQKVFAGEVPTNSFTDVAFTSRVVRPGGTGAVGTDTLQGTDARYLRVFTTESSNAGDNNRFHIGEIRALDPASTNVALGASAVTLDGTVQHGADSALTDGVIDTGGATWSRDPITLGATKNAAAFVDLGSNQFLSSIEVYQRADGCCQDRLRNFTVEAIGLDGTVRQSFFNPGQVATNSFASFVLPDSFTFENNDTLQIELNAGANTGDLLRIGAGGAGSLIIKPNATLTVSNLGGLYSQFQTFNILDFGSISGTFANVNLPALNTPAWFWDTSALYTTGQITAVPEPASAVLLALGAFACVVRRPRSR